MNVKISVLCLSFYFSLAISTSITNSIEKQWDDYKIKFNKTYKADKESIYKWNFKKNLEKFDRHNKLYDEKKVSYKMGINQFADLNDTGIEPLKDFEEPSEDYGKGESEYEPKDNNTFPDSFDWRIHGKLSEVRDKGDCQSDWAFAAVGMLEGYLYKKTNQFTPLSVQDPLECGHGFGNNGCWGGDPNKCFEYVKYHNIATEEEYPFREYDLCKRKMPRTGIPKNLNINYIKFFTNDVKMMKDTIFREGPIAAKIYAPINFFFYAGGIFTGEDCKPDTLDYYVLIVGYGIEKETGEEYWIVKNWLGKGWGENGYAKIVARNNTCGITNKAFRLY